jgi:DNA-binding response OmpR family regulator
MQIGVELSKAVENKRIFVVDDDEIFRAALQFMLHDEYETHEISSVDAAIEKAREWKPDLILLAESVVRAQGLPVVQQLGSETGGAKILVVVDDVSNGFGAECVGAGAKGFLAKPLKIEFVRQKVDAVLGRGTGVTIPLAVLNMR